jgi:hypothetical protein
VVASKPSAGVFFQRANGKGVQGSALATIARSQFRLPGADDLVMKRIGQRAVRREQDAGCRRLEGDAVDQRISVRERE